MHIHYLQLLKILFFLSLPVMRCYSYFHHYHPPELRLQSPQSRRPSQQWQMPRHWDLLRHKMCHCWPTCCTAALAAAHQSTSVALPQSVLLLVLLMFSVSVLFGAAVVIELVTMQVVAGW